MNYSPREVSSADRAQTSARADSAAPARSRAPPRLIPKMQYAAQAHPCASTPSSPLFSPSDENPNLTNNSYTPEHDTCHFPEVALPNTSRRAQQSPVLICYLFMLAQGQPHPELLPTEEHHAFAFCGRLRTHPEQSFKGSRLGIAAPSRRGRPSQPAAPSSSLPRHLACTPPSLCARRPFGGAPPGGAGAPGGASQSSRAAVEPLGFPKP